MKLKPGGYFFSGVTHMGSPYKKPALPIDDQIALLRERGMVINNDKKATHYLAHIGYYRLSAYWLPFELKVDIGEKRDHLFQPETSFDKVLSLYIFDRQLRLLVMEAMERIEISVRTHWAHALALRHGPHAHLDPTLFEKTWHQKAITRMKTDLAGSSETFVKHYKQTYDTPELPPIWAVVETLTFGSLSKWFNATRDNTAKTDMSKRLGMPNVDITQKVLRALTDIRNVSAHHARLWNRRFTLQLPFIRRLGNQIQVEPVIKGKGQNGQQRPSPTLYNYLLVMAHIMNHINPGSSWKQRLQALVRTRSAQEMKAMGFPPDWETRPVWGLDKTP